MDLNQMSGNGHPNSHHNLLDWAFWEPCQIRKASGRDRQGAIDALVWFRLIFLQFPDSQRISPPSWYG
ncbi:hypothetical protein QUA62_27950 [Microcoleus sp. MON1_C1]|uniref:hypothetical protein n=1 Tax=Microcoleus sp. MON1_C1 TaxID=2818827 RepID=UPI002FD6C92E